MLEFARLGRGPDEVGKGRIVGATSDRSKFLWTLMTETDRAVVLSIDREELQYMFGNTKKLDLGDAPG
jgi:hypothetical protein